MATSGLRPNAHGGFTLIELMIVVVIIGILAAIAVPKFSEVSRLAKEAEAAPILKQIYTLQERYRTHHDVLATQLEDLEGGVDSASGAKYYEFTLSSGGVASYVACATPKAGYTTLGYYTIDNTREITRRDGGCT